MWWCVALAFAAAALEPPRAVSAPAAEYPTGASGDAHLTLLLTIDAAGAVTDVLIEQSGGEPFDTRALEAVRNWRFAPALRDGVPIASRLHVPVDFHPPAALPVIATPAEEAVQVVNVKGQRRPVQRGASDFVLDRKTLDAAPHKDAADLLRTAPGVYIAKPEGDAVAHQIFLRGFDAEHGQDIELTMSGLAINRVSHIHGQGYADLNLIMPEVVRSVRVSEGLYDVRQGDFAVAGSIDFDLGVQTERGFYSTTKYGRFNMFRQAVVYAPKDEAEETFGGAFIARTDGFGQNRGSLAGGAIGQYALSLPKNIKVLVHAAAYGARAGTAGVIRYDDIEAGLVDYYGSYSDPSAQAQSALSARAQAMVQLERSADDGARSALQLSFVTTDFNLRENYTGYLQRAIQNPEWVGRGDLIEQRNTDYTLAFKISHRFAPIEWDWGNATAEVGVGYRGDFVAQTQNLLQQPRNETWDKRIDAHVHGSDVHLWGDLQLRFLQRFALRGGVRGDVLYYNVDDALANLTPAYRKEQYYAGYRRTALGAALGPRVSLEFTPLRALKLNASYGEGYRSPQARILEEGEAAPFAKVRSAELGGEWRPTADISVGLAGYATFLANDLAFDAGEGSLTRIGPTSRKGGVFRVQAQPLPWLFMNGSVTYVYATLDAPPVATAENPTPAYRKGQLLPNVPPLVARIDARVDRTLTTFGGGTLSGRVGLGFSALSARPLPYGQISQAFATLDASAALRWRWFELGVEGFNLSNTRYAASDYAFVSYWPNRRFPSGVPTRHIAAAAPLSVSVFLVVRL